MSSNATEHETRFRQLADLLSEDDHRVTRSTMMGFPCLRVDGKFFACVERATGNLIIKLSAERVSELVKTGRGRPFAPNGPRIQGVGSLPSARTRVLDRPSQRIQALRRLRTANLRRQME